MATVGACPIDPKLCSIPPDVHGPHGNIPELDNIVMINKILVILVKSTPLPPIGGNPYLDPFIFKYNHLMILHFRL